MQTITLSVDAQAAASFLAATADEKRKLQLLVSYLLKQQGITPTLDEIMDRMSDYAESRGSTDDKLRDLLAND